MRATLEKKKKKFESLLFEKYEAIDEPQDDRPRNLDDWPELAKWRKRRRARSVRAGRSG